MTEAIVVVGLLVLLVCFTTFGLQALILLIKIAMAVAMLVARLVPAVIFAVLWVFNRKAACKAWRDADVRS